MRITLALVACLALSSAQPVLAAGDTASSNTAGKDDGYWSDGNPDKFSASRLYFTNQAGDHVWRLPYDMPGETAAAELVRY